MTLDQHSSWMSYATNDAKGPCRCHAQKSVDELLLNEQDPNGMEVDGCEVFPFAFSDSLIR
jgi:hypothetical protein